MDCPLNPTANVEQVNLDKETDYYLALIDQVYEHIKVAIEREGDSLRGENLVVILPQELVLVIEELFNPPANERQL